MSSQKTLEDVWKQVSDDFNHNGLGRQAALLSIPDTRWVYVQVLTHPQFSTGVREAVGDCAYQRLETLAQSVPPRSRTNIRPIQPQRVIKPALVVNGGGKVDLGLLEEADRAYSQALDAVGKMIDLIFREADRYVLCDPKPRVLEIYRDLDVTATTADHELREQHGEKIKYFVGHAERMLSDSEIPTFILEGELSRYKRRLPLFKAINEDGTADLRTEYIQLREYALRVINDRALLERNFQGYQSILQEEVEARVLSSRLHLIPDRRREEEEREGIHYISLEDLPKVREIVGYDPDIIERPNIRSHPFDRNSLEEMLERMPDGRRLVKELPEKGFSYHAGDKVVNDATLNFVLTAPLSFRKIFVEESIAFYQCARDVLTGTQQIVLGGQVTNPLAHQRSAAQNHAQFPNIPYSEATKKELSALALRLENILADFPDISNLASSSKLTKGRQLTIEVEELQKDPLDVTFGNDAGCCVFVPDGRFEQLTNGIFVPVYQAEERIRLFGVYRRQETSRHRIGLVMSFECVGEDDTVIMANNSLELSLHGLSGGIDTFRAITSYVEGWLIDYARQNKYDGASMGNHPYNTSRNHSGNKGNLLTQTLSFDPRFNFYSDIFVLDPVDKRLKTRKNGLYWLWKGDGVRP